MKRISQGHKTFILGDKCTKVHPHSYFLSTLSTPFEHKPFFKSHTKDFVMDIQTGYSEVKEICFPSWKETGELMMSIYGVPNQIVWKKNRASFEHVNNIEQCSSETHRTKLGFLDLEQIIRNVQTRILSDLDSYTEFEAQVWAEALRKSLYHKINKSEHLRLENIIASIFLQDKHMLVSSESNGGESAYDRKIKEFEFAASRRKGICLFGPTLAGKSLLIGKCADKMKAKVGINVLLPNSLDTDELYGAFDSNGLWSPGILESIFKIRVLKTRLSCKKWVVFDGEIDGNWFPTISSILENPALFQWGVKKEGMENLDYTFIFEANDLKSISPSEIYNWATIFVNEEVVEWQQFVKLTVKSNFRGEQMRWYIISLLHEILPCVFELLSKVDNHKKKY